MALLDIEVLSEQVRGEKARSFIREAVLCYKAGAYRSCIVATWIALIHDFLEKFRELALSGDAHAQGLVKEFDRIQAARDTAGALKFERDVLDIAKDSYELLSAQEYVDLKRLFEDRNRFGHPNINQDSELLDATPELARTHLRAAVEHVMQRPPVQGKVALSAIQAAVDSPYFPLAPEEARIALVATPLVRAKKVVVRDFYLGCLTSIIKENLPPDQFERRLVAAQVAQKMHGQIIGDLLATKLSATLDRVDDKDLHRLIAVLGKYQDLIPWVSPALDIRLKLYVRGLEEVRLVVLNFAGRIPFLAEAVTERVGKVTAAQLRDFVQRAASAPPRAVIDRAIELLESSKSWDSSNAVLSVISERMMNLLTAADAMRVLKANANGEVKWAFAFPDTVRKIVDKGLLTEADIKVQVLQDGGDGPLREFFQ